MSGVAAAPPIPAAIRRRLTQLGRIVLQAMGELGADDGVHLVFCSRYGEYDRTLGLLQSIAEAEPISPTEFSMSVYNALAGQLSISTKNRLAHTAIAAGRHSFTCGMLEALSMLADRPQHDVLLAYYDQVAPPLFQETGQFGESDLVLGLRMAAPGGDGPDLSLELEPTNQIAPERPAVDEAREFLDFLQSTATELAQPAGGLVWRWRRGSRQH